ncbi:hypothetical protein HDU76_002773 [Blyttiomyces sp. JEL0837]|nr:hypothetical protein HDU76_002773 [Blyttiomyces sp. JEL0837]
MKILGMANSTSVAINFTTCINHIKGITVAPSTRLENRLRCRYFTTKNQLNPSNPSITKLKEVELKLRLFSCGDLERIQKALIQSHGAWITSSMRQTDVFFDGIHDQMMNKDKTVLRIRRIHQGGVDRMQYVSNYELDQDRYIATIKLNMTMKDGVMTANEMESSITNKLAKSLLNNPKSALLTQHPLLSKISAIYNLEPDGLKIVGSYSTMRTSLVMNDGKEIELDDTEFHFGRGWEIEMETTKPQEAEAWMYVYVMSS